MKYAVRTLSAALAIALGGTLLSPALAADSTLLLRQPAVSAHHLVFVYGGDLWIADRQGQNARQLTSHAASEFAPAISPDERWIAFSANYDGNTDVYVMPIEGGQPRRLTWHPGADVVNGWSPDGKRVLFASPREVANNRSNQLFEVALEGGFERKVMEAVAFEGAWSADGKRLAYRPYRQAYTGASGWRQHRGGTTPPVWIIDPKAQTLEKIPHENATDMNPLWVGDQVVFISDRNDGAANLFAYDSRTKQLRQLTHEKLWDVKSASATGTQIVYEVGGRLKQLDLAQPAAEPVLLDIRIQAASIQAREQWKDASRTITSAVLSSSGKRVLVSARGEVFSVPVKDGSVRNLTGTAGAREKDGLWSPDGQRVAYIADAGMKHELVLSDQAGAAGKAKTERHPLGEGYFTLMDWSPDGRTLALHDNHLNLFVYRLDGGKLQKVDHSPRRGGSFETSFSPDSRWLAYTVTTANHFSQIRLHDLQTGQQHALSDGLSHASNPVFAPGGDYLYFSASTNSGPTHVGLDMSTEERPLRFGLYAAVLSSEGRSPLLPKSGDEDPVKKAEAKPAEKTADKASEKAFEKAPEKAADKSAEKPTDKVKPVRIDFAGLQQRFVGLPVAERFYDGLQVAADGALFYLERRQRGISVEPPEAEAGEGAELWRFDFSERKAKSLRAGVSGFSLSGDGKKLLLQLPKGRLEVGEANDKLDAKAVDLGGLKVRIDPRQEWRQIFDETWWMEKEYFYDAGLHGIDWQAVYKRYQALLPHVQRREDLNDVLVEMIGELQVGHNRVGGGDVQQEAPVTVGLLGADFELDQGLLRIKKIYRGDRWNPFLKAPLAAPGLGVKEGDYLLSVNGQGIDGRGNLFALLEGSVGKQLTLGVASDAKGGGLRQVVVEPVARDAGLRQWDWIEQKREHVNAKTGGKVAYVYLPDTGQTGYHYFNRLFFAQSDKPALIVDDRRNGGGHAANYIIELLNRPYLSGWSDRDGLVFNTPGSAIHGPKVMLIDQDAGSGGDFLPWAFKRTGLGPLIGTRTWGGLIGIASNPPLIDGGALLVPDFRFFTPDGEWRIENEGTAPDIEVELDPLLVNKGVDSQLEAAIANVMQQLATHKSKVLTSPPPRPTQLGK
ncbi:PDZ domain-containing protein [Paucibacter sp. APW11]|uniref:Tricorn protease homolog n=1 Tax=Roseateles aquae TaxID=3077235 RepID=A0ABU3P6H6_9BURK|nr:S41 family peptidase [Paucibacter sp. APW11]MDT8997673.1 PDZ domain-containing protein [Paucibacter sp. APW11]